VPSGDLAPDALGERTAEGRSAASTGQLRRAERPQRRAVPQSPLGAGVVTNPLPAVSHGRTPTGGEVMSAARVVVIGGGYAGTMAANRLTRHEGLDITVINPRPRFVERIRLHQQVAGSRDAALAYDTVLSKRVRLLVNTVERIDPVQRSLHLASGNQVPYDYLIYAAGSTGSTANVPGAQEFAYSIATLEEAERLGLALRAAPIEAAVTVVGGGPTGIETAAELSERGHLVTLVSAQFGPSLHPRARRRVARQLQRLGVQVLDRAAVTAVQSEAVELADGRRLRSDVTIWTAGFGVPDLAARSGLRTDGLGRLVTDETLSSVDDARIVAAGDAASPSAMP